MRQSVTNGSTVNPEICHSLSFLPLPVKHMTTNSQHRGIVTMPRYSTFAQRIFSAILKLDNSNILPMHHNEVPTIINTNGTTPGIGRRRHTISAVKSEISEANMSNITKTQIIKTLHFL
jgi:hypothetical protein